MSHMLEYIPANQYEDLFLEIWRVLRPCGILRLSDLDGYVWRPIGCERTHGTGKIESTPTYKRIREALWHVGFQIFPSKPGFTLSPHTDVLQGDTRLRHWKRGNKFYIEAVKAQMNVEMKRVRFHDLHMVRSGRYYHVDYGEAVKLFREHSRVVGNTLEITR